MVETECVLGEEREGGIATDTQYTMYREELLDTYYHHIVFVLYMCSIIFSMKTTIVQV